MTAFADMTTAEQVASLSDCVAEILTAYDLSSPTFESINHDYNSTFKVSTANAETFALRVNVNSPRTEPNLAAEVFWVYAITSVKTPKPVANRDGSFSSQGWHEASGRNLHAVLYTWLEGEELGDEPTVEQLGAAGALMAKLHETSSSLTLPAGAELPDFADFFWGGNDLLLSAESQLNLAEQGLIAELKDLVADALATLSADSPQQLIHADVHPFNLMWHQGQIAAFDFDDCGFGLPIQDLATSLYYLDTEEQEQAFKDGYTTVRPLPAHTDRQMRLLKHHRRVLLLNYLFESTNPEHRAMIESYRARTFELLAQELGRGA